MKDLKVIEGTKGQEIVSMLIKPTHDCNFNCEYCYDRPFREKYKGTVMSMETLADGVRLLTSGVKKARIIWHGGEPTYVGVDWYKRAQEVLGLFYGSALTQSMQSNGSLLNKDWARFSKEYSVSIGVSFDGPYQSVRGSSHEKMEKILMDYRDAGGDFGVISVVNQYNYKHMIEMYEYFKNVLEVPMAMNTISPSKDLDLESLEMSTGGYSRELREFARHLIYDADGRRERTVMAVISALIGFKDPTCLNLDCRYKWVSMNPIGDLYPCDRYYPERYRLGHVSEFDKTREVFETPGYKLYAGEVAARYKNQCVQCRYFEFCGGGCNAAHLGRTGSVAIADEHYCQMFEGQMKVVYSVLREIDYYDRPLNPEVSSMIGKNVVFLPREIEEFLITKGFSRSLVGPGEDGEFLDTEEYKVFRLFNKLQWSMWRDLDKKDCYEFSGKIESKDMGFISNLKTGRWKVLAEKYERLKPELEKLLGICLE